jgi:hypothetical protein
MSSRRSPQRRHLDLDHARAGSKRSPETARRDLRSSRFRFGRRDDADVDVRALVRADPLDDAVLEHAQELRLERQRRVADLVEEERAAVGQLELPDPLGDGAR